jgi:predicted small secreted protein
MKTNTRHICLLLLATALRSSGCRTFRGFGQDVQHAGNHIERAANH